MKAFSSFVCASCRRTLNSQLLRTVAAASKSSHRLALTSTPASSRSISSTSAANADDAITRALGQGRASTASSSFNISSLLNRADGDRRSDGPPAAYDPSVLSGKAYEVPHRLHVYATKHNTHITFTQPPKKDTTDSTKMVDVLLSMSAGNIGFRKAGRGSYDAGYQLAAFILKQIQERGLLRDIHKIEVVLRGFGAGREAVSKALLGQEGRLLRNKITSVKDATRLKFGGTRSPKPRRLG